MTPSSVLGVFTAVFLVIVPTHAHRDGEGSSASSRMKLQSNTEAHQERAMVTRQGLNNQMKTLDKKCKGIAHPSQEGIEALKSCVAALEEYASNVRLHEKESFKAHGRYRRAFIQTYALLKSVLGPNNQLHKFRNTFIANHTKAGHYLQEELAKVKNTVDEIGSRWTEPDSDGLPDVNAGMEADPTATASVLQTSDSMSADADADADAEEAADSDAEDGESSFLETASDGHLQNSRHSRHIKHRQTADKGGEHSEDRGDD